MKLSSSTIKVGLAALALVLGGASLAQAHTTSIGFVSAGTPGAVTFYTGTYTNGLLTNEGTLTLTQTSGGSFSSTKSFDIAVVYSKPVGLVDGTNNFYWTTPNFSGPLDQTLTSDPGVLGGVRAWQGVTFSGLTAGDYTFSCGSTCGTSFAWDSWSGGSGTLTLTGAVVGTPNPIPEPATILLFGSGLVGLAAWRMRKTQKA